MGGLPQLQKKLLLAISVLLAFQSASFLWRYFQLIDQSGQPFGMDFALFFYKAAQQAVAGQFSSIYDVTSLQQALAGMRTDAAPFPYPPYMLFLIMPLASLSYGHAVLLWSVLPLPFYFGLLYLFFRRCQPDGEVSVFIIISGIILPMLMHNIMTGQTGTIMATLFLALIVCWQRYSKLAGLFTGAMALKPQLGILLPFALCAACQWRTILCAIATLAILVAASLLYFGVPVWMDYVHLTGLFASFVDANAGQFSKLAFGPYVSLRSSGFSASLCAAIQMVITLFIMGVITGIFRSRDERQDLRFALLACGIPLATPYTLVYDCPLLGVALTPFLLRIWRNGWADLWEISAFTFLLIMPYAQLLLENANLPFAMLSTSLFFIVLFRRYHAARS